MRSVLIRLPSAAVVLLCSVVLRGASLPDAPRGFRPGEVWRDTAGRPINAHGGGILVHEGVYYWYGESKQTKPTPDPTRKRPRVAATGVACYSSTNLMDWVNQGIVLATSTNDPAGDLHPRRVLERPKVIYNRSTGKFVLWLHIDSPDYRAARSGVAVADKPTGPFKYLGSLRPNAGVWPRGVTARDKTPDDKNFLARDFADGQMARDMTLFVDDDGTAYQFYAAEENSTLQVSQLSPDYLRPAGKYARLFAGRFMEAPAVFKRGGKYYLIMSGCTGWAPNAARAAVAESIWGPWTELDNPWTGPEAEVSYNSQSTFVLPVPGRAGTYIFMADRWNPGNLEDSRYVWLPLRFDPTGRPQLRWVDSWNLPALPKVPGTVIHHRPAASGLYIGSPSLALLPNGDYLASHDYFGPASDEHQCATLQLFRSRDRGETWSQAGRLKCLFWHKLFTHRGNVYLMGTEKHHGRIVIRRSTDNGQTWTEPRDTSTGLLSPEGQYHCAPMPVIEHHGRLWRAFEDAAGGTEWGKRYRAMMLSAAVDADLLQAKSWTFSNFLERDPAWLGGKFQAWLEGNAVVAPDGRMLDILRVQTPDYPERAALVEISPDGKTASFDPATGFIEFPGGGKKFVIRYDERTKCYWALATPALEPFQKAGAPGSIRNTLALLRSTDLRQWETRCLLLRHPDTRKHGFQYPDWQFDGEDMVAVVRTAYDDDLGGAHNNHDANFLTFHRFKNFRSLSMQDSAPTDWTEEDRQVETGGLLLRGNGWELTGFGSGAKAFANRDYTWLEVPARYEGWQFTRNSGGERSELAVRATQNQRLRLAASLRAADRLEGWSATGETFAYTDANRTRMAVYTREVKSAEEVMIPQTGWTGALLLVPPSTGSTK